MDLLTLNHDTNNRNENNQLETDLGMEGGGLRSAWSPDHEFERDQEQPTLTFATLGDRISKRFTSIAQQPEFWNKFGGDSESSERKKVGWLTSIVNVIMSSWLNVFLVFLPMAWAFHYMHGISHAIQFAFCFLTLIPLCKILEYGGENMAFYCGKDLGDLIIVTLNNAVEAILALLLLAKCELRLLQATIIGVVLLRLLLIPGTSFITGGARVASQQLHPHVTQLNQSLLTTGVLFLLLPVSFFAALDRGKETPVDGVAVVSDAMRGNILKVSRGMAIILFAVYICSRFFLHVPIGEETAALHLRKDAPEELKKVVEHMEEEEPEVNPWVCIIALLITVGLTAVTAEFLVESIHPLKEKVGFNEEWFGLIVLPIVSFSADGLLSIVYFVRSTFFKQDAKPPPTLAEYRPIELSIQFILLWTPFVVLLGWFTHKPMSLLFDFFEVAILLGACFLVNYVTADSKTNWAEGVMLVALYITIALTAWFYPGQPEIHAMLSCSGVAKFVAAEKAQAEAVGATHETSGTSDKVPVAGADPAEDVPLSQKLQALLKLYDVLLSGDLDKVVEGESEGNEGIETAGNDDE